MIPEFPQFKKLELSDRVEIYALLEGHLPYSDFDFGSMWSWDTHGHMRISRMHKSLIVRFVDYLTGTPFYTFIGTGNDADITHALLSHSETDGLTPELRLIPEVIAHKLDAEHYLAVEDPDNTDYVLSVERLALLEGAELAAKRRAVSQFTRRTQDYEFKELDISSSKVKQEMDDLFHLWFKNKESVSGSIEDEHEYQAFKKCLVSAESLNVLVTGVYIEGVLSAFWKLGKLENGHAISHFEKANTKKYIGIFPFLKQETAKVLLQHNIQFINLEQDLGIEGLRQSKKAYAPALFLKKYKIRRKEAK